MVAVTAARCARLSASDCVAILGAVLSSVERMHTEKLLASIPLFDALTSGERAALLHALELRTVGAADVIIQQGQSGEAFYILQSGAVEIVREDTVAGTRATVVMRGG